MILKCFLSKSWLPTINCLTGDAVPSSGVGSTLGPASEPVSRQIREHRASFTRHWCPIYMYIVQYIEVCTSICICIHIYIYIYYKHISSSLFTTHTIHTACDSDIEREIVPKGKSTLKHLNVPYSFLNTFL